MEPKLMYPQMTMADFERPQGAHVVRVDDSVDHAGHRVAVGYDAASNVVGAYLVDDETGNVVGLSR